jgi:hypothetical protein
LNFLSAHRRPDRFAQREALIAAPPDYLPPDLPHFLAHVPL